MTQEEQWVLDARRGDSHAFRFLVKKYQDYVFTIAMRILGNRHEAEEVAQDVFVKVWRRLPSFEGRAAFSTWLYRIAWRASIDKLRCRKKNTRSLDDEFTDRLLQLPYPEDDPQDQLAQKDLATSLRHALMLLKPDDAALLRLYYFKELSVKEVCQVTGLTESNVKVKLFRARTALKNLLSEVFRHEIHQFA